MSSVGRRLPWLVVVALTGGPALAQNLDDGKSGAQLFTANCATCHHSPRGLAKDRSSWTLSSFLQQHYSSSSASAQVLAAYLESVDAPRAKSSARENVRENVREKDISVVGPPPRPPAAVPSH